MDRDFIRSTRSLRGGGIERARRNSLAVLLPPVPRGFGFGFEALDGRVRLEASPGQHPGSRTGNQAEVLGAMRNSTIAMGCVPPSDGRSGGVM